MTVDPATFRKGLSYYPTGVSVVSIAGPDGVQGMTVGSLSSVSLEPPLVLFCVAEAARLAPLLVVGRDVSINVLRADQSVLSTYFASGWKEPVPPPHRFVPWGGKAFARLEGAAVALAARITAINPGGDHSIVICQVSDIHVGLTPIEPLIFFDRRYHGVDTGPGGQAPELDARSGASQLFHDPWV